MCWDYGATRFYELTKVINTQMELLFTTSAVCSQSGARLTDGRHTTTEDRVIHAIPSRLGSPLPETFAVQRFFFATVEVKPTAVPSWLRSEGAGDYVCTERTELATVYTRSVNVFGAAPKTCADISLKTLLTSLAL